jgi:hypothetical protein
MSLTDRLQRARTQQLIDSGILPTDYVAEPELDTVDEVEPDLVLDDPSTPSGGLFAPVTIEVPPVGLHLVPDVTVDLTDTPEQPDGTESRCPNCNADGVVDMIDLVGHTVHYTCGICSTMWQVRKEFVPEGTVAS